MMSYQFNRRALILVPVLLFLLLIFGGGPVGEVEGQEKGPCLDIDLNTKVSEPCEPCGKDEDWLELILKQRDEQGASPEGKCFNSFPLGINIPKPNPELLTETDIEYAKLNLDKLPRGFKVTGHPFLRYNALPGTDGVVSSECTNDCSGPTFCDIGRTQLDIGDVKKYYHNRPDNKEIDLQLIEWPGRTHDQHKDVQEEAARVLCGDETEPEKPYHCKYKSPFKFQMLRFHKESSKLLHYPCNREEGSQISVFGLMSIQDRAEKKDREEPHNAVYLTFNSTRLFHTHTPPIYVSEHVLNEMAKLEGMDPIGICRKDEPECFYNDGSEFCTARQRYFEQRGEIIFNKGVCSGKMLIPHDLRTVLDLTFVQGRLILAMRCGVLVVDNILVRKLNVYASTLLSSVGKHKNTFKPVTKIASNHCCKTEGCRTTIIAAYPSAPKVSFDNEKEIYISYDLGETFMVKLIAEPISALNLMWGMFRMYGNWLLYQQLLDTPDLEDLKNEKGDELIPGYVDLRSKPDWDSLTTEEREKRFLYGEGRENFTDLESAKKNYQRYVLLRTHLANQRFVRKRGQKQEIDLDLSPEWLKNEIKQFRQKSKWYHQWTDANCDSIPQCRAKFENDPAVKYFLNQSDIIVKTPKRAFNEPFCDQIVSLAVLEEQDTLYVLCVVGFGDFSVPKGTKPPCSSRQADDPNKSDCIYTKETKEGTKTMEFKHKGCVKRVKYYAIFSLSIEQKLPLALFEERRTERLFTCRNYSIPLDWNKCKSLQVLPDMIRVPNSIALLVKNCRDVLFYSPNGGRTVFNTEFYAHNTEAVKSQADDCDQVSSGGGTKNQRQLMYRINSLADVPPQIEISPLGNVVLMTMRNKYAYGLLGGNKGFKMIVGDIFLNEKGSVLSRVQSNDFAFPSFTISGAPFFGVALKLIYSHNPVLGCELFGGRNGIRLVRMDSFIYKEVAFYYNENEGLLHAAREKGRGVDVCHTLDFKVKPKVLRLDVGESAKVEVNAYDVRPNIPLSILSSDEKSNTVDVDLLDRDSDENEHLTHDWDVKINAIRNYKSRINALTDSFFGIENNNMFGYNTEISLANDLELRCHVQPAATIQVYTQCRDRKLVAHEDEHRPQCTKGTFSKKVFTYTLKQGEFDPNLVAFWKEMDKAEGKKTITLNKDTGDIEIIYDYIRFGCPLEPYKEEHYIPDLRIASLETNFNSSLGEKYNGPFLMVELFGAKGFYFTKKFKDEDCKFVPINITKYIEDWVHRKRMFRIAHDRQTSPTFDEIHLIRNAKNISEILALQYGNQLFDPEAVDDPINIINRVTYRDCRKWRSFFLESENESQTIDDLPPDTMNRLKEQEFPIMKREGPNQIGWGKNSHPIYVFMAVALDPTESLCEYYTIFGVSIPDAADSNSLITFGIFLLLVLLWIALFICCYTWRRSRIREMCIDLERKRRLEEAAWKVVYRYEKLLQEHENYYLEEEFKEFREIEDEKLRIRTEAKGYERHQEGHFRQEDPVENYEEKAANINLKKRHSVLTGSHLVLKPPGDTHKKENN